MFVLSTIKDTIPVLPANFGVDTEEALINEINKKYANRVLHDVGLCICLFDLAEAGEGKVRYGDGCHWYKVKFRSGRVILAKVKSSDEDGIRLSRYVPSTPTLTASYSDPNERAHFWLPDSEATTAHELLESLTAERMYVDQGDIVRVRVEADEFYDDEPGPPKATDGVAVKREARRPPYTITCSIAEQGLGPVSWWKSAQPEAEVMDDT
ncbi:RNA polymerase Rpb7 [Pisolithus orientalis]|uniref:RNA polymerase Rpb7 n=1 Tax=Pisolithus orientalis TaxID=936130 RepID=UPI0022253A9C|nr:RNA polymerase Rpb7 [Pisolithus orientalis]KAI6006688.1 RNA polymerase Rpb7 [Pisolithus orientalis]